MEVICSNCGESYPHTIQYFKPSKGCRDGLTSVCRTCANTYSRQWKKEHQVEQAARRRKAYAERYGEIQRQKERDRRDIYPYKVRAQVLRAGMRERSRAFDLPFDARVFTVKYLINWLQNTPNCPCCSKPFEIGFKHDHQKNDRSPSLDRIHPERGYIAGNVALICWRCNNLKRDATPDELQMVVDWMRNAWGNCRTDVAW